MNNQHGVEFENELNGGEEFELKCYCGFDAVGKRTIEANARNAAYIIYRNHLFREIK